MKRSFLIAALVFTAGAQALDAQTAQTVQAARAAKTPLADTRDSVSYAIGIIYGTVHAMDIAEWNSTIEYLKSDIYPAEGSDSAGLSGVEKNISFAAFNGALDDLRTMSEADKTARARTWLEFLDNYLSGIPAENLRNAEAYLARVEAENPDVRKTASGLLYRIVAPGDSADRPDDNDHVIVRYTKRYPDGTRARRYNNRGNQNDYENIELDMANQIKGQREALKLVGKGGRIKTWLHPSLAYGAGDGTMPNNAVLLYDVEIIEVIHYR